MILLDTALREKTLCIMLDRYSPQPFLFLSHTVKYRCIQSFVLIAICLLGVTVSDAKLISHTETILFSAVGYTTKDGNLNDQQERAVLAAKFLAEKQLANFLNSFPVGAELSSSSDDWKSAIKITDTRAISSDDQRNNGLYGVLIAGSLEIDVPVDGDTGLDKSNPSLLHVDFESNKQDYLEGDTIVFGMKGNQNFFAGILDLNEQGEITQLLPNIYRPENAFIGGEKYFFPESGTNEQFKLEVSAPFGTEKVYLIASSVPFQSILPLTENVFTVVNDDMAEVLKPLRQKLMDSLFSSPSAKLYQCIQLSTSVLTLTTRQSGNPQ